MVRVIDGCALFAFLGATNNKWTTTTTRTSSTTLHHDVICMSTNDEPRTQRDVAQQQNKDVLLRSTAISVLLWQQSSKAVQATVFPTSSTTVVKGSMSGGALDLVEARRVIESGQVFSVDNFLEPALVEALRDEIKQYAADNKFKPSGLSNFAKAGPGQKDKQGFGKNDRGTAPVTFSDPANSEMMVRVGDLIDEVRLGLAKVMNRPTMADITLGHESYFSRSLEGVSLARHMDEHHEETKGRRGWTTSSRRSISWLLYLSDFEWDLATSGGGLRAFPQSLPVSGACGADEGNLQVGWWKVQLDHPDGVITPTAAGTATAAALRGNDYNAVRPVFLDCWRRQYVNNKATSIARAALYVQELQNGREVRRYLTVDFDIRDPETGAALDRYDAYFKPDDAYAATAAVDTTVSSYSSASMARRFLKTEDVPAWQQGLMPAGSREHITSPKGGTLVMFDSVALPHEVMTTIQGERLALAGWLHEKQQKFPSWYT